MSLGCLVCGRSFVPFIILCAALIAVHGEWMRWEERGMRFNFAQELRVASNAILGKNLTIVLDDDHTLCLPRGSRISLPSANENALCPPQTRNKEIEIKTRALIRLASFPGSGNTYTRQLVERGSGYHTGSIYATELYLDGSGQRVKQTREMILVKNHEPHCQHLLLNYKEIANLTKEEFRAFQLQYNDTDKVNFPRPHDATIFLVRNPVTAIRSYFNKPWIRIDKTLARQFADFTVMATPCWKSMLRHYMHTFKFNKRLDTAWLDAERRPTLVVYYEDLILHRDREVARMFEFINAVQKYAIVKDVAQAVKCAAIASTKTLRESTAFYDEAVTRDGVPLLQHLCQTLYDASYWHPAWKECLAIPEGVNKG